MMTGMSKADTLDLLEAHGMNTVDRIVVRKPFKAEQLIVKFMTSPHNVISLRSWKKGKHLCPFYPNQTQDQLLQIMNKDWDKLKVMDEIILSEGIDPEKSQMAGKILDTGNEYLVEYFKGPGTVRKLDTITPLTKRLPRKLTLGVDAVKDDFKIWAPLYIAAKAFFRAYPGTILEWSKYPNKIGKKKENFIFWEVI